MSESHSVVPPTGYRGNPLRKEDMSEIMKDTKCGNHKRISGGFIETMRKLNLRPTFNMYLS